MIVDIRGTNTRNKGAQLMLEAICARLGGQFEFSVAPATTDRQVRRRLGLRRTLFHPALPALSAAAGNALPAGVASGWNLVSDSEIGGVLDASGFHYTDQLPTAFSRSEALIGRARARRGVPKVVMPQAFGPFEKPATRRWTREALEQAGLVFVRDSVSESYVRQLDISTRIVRSPDFTMGIKPAELAPISKQPFLAVVPNKKMFTHGDLNRRQYVEVLAGYSAAASAAGLASVIVVHEQTDRRIANQLADRTGASVFSHADPLVLKAALGQSAAAVASRFHAVVGCISQSIPTLALGWSHKYRELLDDFEVADRLVTPDSDPGTALTNLLSDSAGDARQRDRLPALLEQIERMWEQAVDVLTDH